MAWLGENQQKIEELLFSRNRNLFSSLSMVFFDTTSLYFEGRGGESLGRQGYSRDRRPDEAQMVVGVVMDDKGRPISCPCWSGDTPDVQSLTQVASSLSERFGVGDVTVVADRGMVGAKNMDRLSLLDFPVILGGGCDWRKRSWVRCSHGPDTFVKLRKISR
jgi:transposase